MWFLIAQILLLLLLAAALGAGLGMWWVKRRYEDVTETHDDLLMQANKLDALAGMPTRDELKVGLGELSSSVAALRMPDLSPVEQQLARLEESVKAFAVPPPDLSPIQRRLELIESIVKAPDIAMDQVRSRINAIEAAVAQVSQSVSRLSNTDLAPVEAKLSDLETAFLSMKLPEVDLGPVHSSLARLGLSVDDLKTSSNVDPVQAALGQLKTEIGEMGEHLDNAHKMDVDAVMQRIDALSAAVTGMKPVDLDPLHQRFATVEQAVGAIQPEIEEQHRRALAPMERRVAGLQEALGSMPETDLAPVIEAVHAIDSREDLVAVENRLTAIEYSLTALHHMLRSRAEAAMMQPWQARPTGVPGNGDIRVQPGSPQRPSRETDPINPVRRPGGQANLLVEPAFGPPDNLELIHGVGPILRSILNDRGIYYFWQVAEWSPEDAAQIDAQLMEFRGRIRRDDWVRHAGQLAALPTSAKRPVSQYGRRE